MIIVVRRSSESEPPRRGSTRRLNHSTMSGSQLEKGNDKQDCEFKAKNEPSLPFQSHVEKAVKVTSKALKFMANELYELLKKCLFTTN